MPDAVSPTDTEILRAEIVRLRAQLEESQETLRAIRSGEIDAFVVTNNEEPTVMTLGAAEQTYQLIVDQVSHPTAVLNCEGRILQTNALFAALVQREPVELSGVLIQDLVTPASLKTMEFLLENGTDSEVEKELIVRSATGLRIPVSFSVRPLKDNPTGLCLLLTDLTAERLRDRIVSEELLAQSILEQVADAVVVCDPRGRIVRASRAVETLMGGDPLDRAFDAILPLQHAINGELQPLPFREIIASPETRGREVVYVDATGRHNHLVLSVGLLSDSDAAVRGVVLTLTDITARKSVEEALELADRRKNEFLAILAHELRNPLAPISNSVSILSVGKLSPEVRDRAVVLMDRQVKQMVRLVDDLMDVSRITRGKVELKKERVRLADIVAGAVETSQPLIEQFSHALSVDLPEAPIWLDADVTRLTQIFSNLLNNAAKYSEAGGRITVSSHTDASRVRVDIADTGIGIRPDMVGRIFDMFAQVDGSLERAHGGLGVGLTLVKTLVEMHGGMISVHSDGPGKGSTFTVDLPVAVVEQETAAVSEHGIEEASSSGLRIMIVEDNEALAQTTGWLVEMLGHDYRLAHSGREALDTVMDYRPQVMMLDIGLPGMNGYDLCRELRQLPDLKDTVFIAQTGWGQDEHRQRAREAGFDHHMVKPIALDSLDSVLVDIKARS